jgi:hypothetical protein
MTTLSNKSELYCQHLFFWDFTQRCEDLNLDRHDLLLVIAILRERYQLKNSPSQILHLIDAFSGIDMYRSDMISADLLNHNILNKLEVLAKLCQGKKFRFLDNLNHWDFIYTSAI